MSATTAEARGLLRAAAPLMLAEGGMMLMEVVDTLFVAGSGRTELAGLALGSIIVFSTTNLGFAAALGAEPLIAQAFGRKNPARAWGWACQALYLGLALSIPLVGIALALTFSLEAVGISPAIAAAARGFVFARLVAVPAIASANVFRFYNSAAGRGAAVLQAVVVANAINAVLDLALVAGVFGLPRLGAAGSAIATSACNVVFVGAWGVTAIRETRRDPRMTEPPRLVRPSLERMGKVLRLGWPGGASAWVDTAILMVISTLVGVGGAVALAAHQIASSIASLHWMTSAGLASATSARVGYRVGDEDPRGARHTALTAVGTSALLMAASGAACAILAGPLAGAFTADDAVRDLATVLLRWVGVFVVFDGAQQACAGALRGTGDLRWNLFAGLLSFWGFGLPIGYSLGTLAGWGPAGYWLGLTAGVAAMATLLFTRLWRVSAGALRRLEITHVAAGDGLG